VHAWTILGHWSTTGVVDRSFAFLPTGRCVTVDIDGRCQFTYLKIRSISTVDVDSPTWAYGRYRRSTRMPIHLPENTVDIASTVDFRKKSVEIDRRCGFMTKKNRSTAFSEKSKIRTIDLWSHRFWEMVPDTHPPRSHGLMRGEKWSQHLSKYRHLSTDLFTRLISHGRYRRSMPIL